MYSKSRCLLLVNDCFYDKRNAEVDFIGNHDLEILNNNSITRT